MGLSENKFGRLPGTRLPEQKPFRGFDITSLIRKDGAEEERASSVNRAESKSTNLGQRSRRLHQSPNTLTQKLTRFLLLAGEDRKSPTLGAGSPCSSPNISVGPPQSPPTNPYTNLFNSSLYQQYLGQLLANGGGPQAPLNPMLLQVSNCPHSLQTSEAESFLIRIFSESKIND